MKAVAVRPSEREVVLLDLPAPRLEKPSQAKLRILDVGVCGTDREICAFDYGTAPDGSDHLVIGHECLAEVAEVGADVTRVRPGDLVVPMVRRPCPHASCVACRAERQDFCFTGDFRERGIKQADGYMTELAVVDERWLNRVPSGLRDVGVLVEPLTIAEKALIQLWQVQERLPWDCPHRPGKDHGHCRTAVVLGAGPVGLAYEFAFGDVNPPVHAWAAWRVYKISGARGKRDRAFLRRVFDKLAINFTWWVNRKDAEGNHVFGGGFLGLDNIGVFDRSQPLPTGGHLEQADGTAWMAFYCATMLAMALELAAGDPVYEDVASKFFEHFVRITAAMNELGGNGLWDEEDGFYYDQIHHAGHHQPLKVRSLVGLLPLCAVEALEESALERLPGFAKRLRWFLAHRSHVGRHVTRGENGRHGHLLLSVVPRDRLERMLSYVLDEREFLAPHGIRSVSRVHAEHPYRFFVGEQEHRVDYVPGESTSGLFGGNSNWRGPIWFPVNYLLLEALERHHHFYGDALQVELPTGSGRRVTLREAAQELSCRLARLFLPDERGVRPCHGADSPYSRDPHFRELLTFSEYFHGDSGRGLGARYQGWTYLVARCLEDLALRRLESA